MLRRFVSESLSEQRSYRRDGSVHLVERSLLYVICVGAVGAFKLVNSILAGITVSLGGLAFGSWVPCSDESRDRP
jgi:hypothetical protein